MDVQASFPAELRSATAARHFVERSLDGAGCSVDTIDDARRLIFIRRAKELGFALNDISELLKLRSGIGAGKSVERVRTVAKKKLEAVDSKIAELQRIRAVLNDLVLACPGHGDTDHCPILRAFDDIGAQL